MKKVEKVQLSEAISKTSNVMNVIQLYQAVMNLESIADKETDPKYHIHVVDEIFTLMFETNQTLLEDLEKVVSMLYRFYHDEE